MSELRAVAKGSAAYVNVLSPAGDGAQLQGLYGYDAADGTSTGDNRLVGQSSLTTNSFVINHRTTAGVLTDGNARITVMVTGYYG